MSGYVQADGAHRGRSIHHLQVPLQHAAPGVADDEVLEHHLLVDHGVVDGHARPGARVVRAPRLHGDGKRGCPLHAEPGRALLAQRGEIVDVEAAVCFCDLRNFTELSQQLDQAELIELLDDAFGAVVGAVEAERGDVLKFIGDAVLAVFRVEGDETARVDAVTRAFRAACGALERASALHQERLAAGRAPLVIGLSLHLGHVAYGNIGSPTRLDFTVIGAAVNLASRLEGLCRTLGYPIVMSHAVASRLGAAPLVDAGSHRLKGIPEPVHVWAVTEGAAAESALNLAIERS